MTRSLRESCRPPLSVRLSLSITLALLLQGVSAQVLGDPVDPPPAEAASAPPAPVPAPAPIPAPGPIQPLPAANVPQLEAPTTLLPQPNWQELSRAQKQALAPLEREWNGMDPARKSKWLEIGTRFASLPASEQARLHDRMRDWARLSPAERQQARIGYQVAQQLKASDRQAMWEAYQALPPEKRQELAEKAAQKLSNKPQGPARRKNNVDADAPPQPKSNVVPPAPRSQPVKPVAPSVLQAKPGATTVLITQVPSLPAHQQAGQTKVFADPTLVDSKTLLPRRASAPTSR